MPETLPQFDIKIGGRPRLPRRCRVPGSPPFENIKANLPLVLESLIDAGLVARPMILTALATIGAEPEKFDPMWKGNRCSVLRPRIAL